MTTLEILPIITGILQHKNELRGVIEYHGEEEGCTMLIDFSNCGEPYPEDKVCVWSKQRTITDENGEYRGTEEVSSGSFKTFVNAVLHILLEVDGTDNEFYADSF